MKHEVATVERFYTDNAGKLQMKLIAGAKGLKRVIHEPTVNRPAWRWRLHEVFCEQTRPGLGTRRCIF